MAKRQKEAPGGLANQAAGADKPQGVEAEMTVTITAKVAGFRRCGIAHPAEPTEYPADLWSEEELDILKKEPNLVVLESRAIGVDELGEGWAPSEEEGEPKDGADDGDPPAGQQE